LIFSTLTVKSTWN